MLGSSGIIPQIQTIIPVSIYISLSLSLSLSLFPSLSIYNAIIWDFLIWDIINTRSRYNVPSFICRILLFSNFLELLEFHTRIVGYKMVIDQPNFRYPPYEIYHPHPPRKASKKVLDKSGPLRGDIKQKSKTHLKIPTSSDYIIHKKYEQFNRGTQSCLWRAGPTQCSRQVSCRSLREGGTHPSHQTRDRSLRWRQ